MQITLNINDNLIQETKDINPDLTFERALKLYLEQQKRLKILDLFATIDYE